MDTLFPHYRRTYPYLWAADVVDSFIDCYTRATWFTAKWLDIKPKRFRELLVSTLMRGDSQWNRVRETIKAIEKRDMYDELWKIPPEKRRGYLTSVSLMIWEAKSDVNFDWKLIDTRDIFG